MSKKGFLKVLLQTVTQLRTKQKQCIVKAISIDTIVSSKVSGHQQQSYQELLLPISQKITFQIHSISEDYGYFELPMKKIYQHPTKRHSVTIKCITKEHSKQQPSPQIFGVLRVVIMYFQNHIAKLDILISKVQIKESEKIERQREIFVETIVGNVSSQTTIKKMGESDIYEWKQVLPFTLQSIPGKIEFSVREKNSQINQNLGKLILDPHIEKFFEYDNNKQQKTYRCQHQNRKITFFFSKIFKIPENQ